MKLRSFLSGLIAVVVVLLLIGGGGFYWIAAQSPLNLLANGQGKIPSAAMFVPRQTPAVVSMLVNPDDLGAFRRVVAAPEDRRRAREELAQFKQSLLANTGLNYEQDVQPWVGDEVTLAITTLDMDRDRANGRQPGYLLAIATKNPERSREFLQLFWQKQAIAGADLTFEQYKGVKLIYKDEGRSMKDETANSSLISHPSSLASAVVGDQFVLFANHPKVLRDAVNNVQATELNLANASFYTEALDTLTQPRIGLTFVNLPRLASWLKRESVTSLQEPQTQDKQQKLPAGNDRTMAIALELDRRGLLAETAMSALDRGKVPVLPTLTQPVAALQYIPAISPASASGVNLDRQWNGLSNSLSDYGAIAQLVNQPFQALETRWKLNVPQDIFSWVQGEYALGEVPGARETGNEKREEGELFGGDWVFVAERTDEQAGKQAIAHLDEIARQQGLSTGTLELGEQTVSAWTKLSPKRDATNALQAEVQGVHTTVGNYEIFATSIAAMEAALKTGNTSLNQSDRFQRAISPISQPNAGYLYLDWNESRPLLEQRVPLLRVIELAGSSIFSHLRSLTVSSYGNQAGVQRGAVFINLS